MQNAPVSRAHVPVSDTWDLSKLFPSDAAWEAEFANFKEAIPGLEAWKGRLAEGVSTVAECLKAYFAHEEQGERLGYYAFLRYAEDAGDSANQDRQGRFTSAAVAANAAISYLQPELQALPAELIDACMAATELGEYHIYLEKLFRYKPHILSASEERILSLSGESAQTPRKVFGALTDVDMDFGEIDTPEGLQKLTQSTYGSLIQHQDRKVREEAFVKFHGTMESHKNTLASLYAGSVQKDVFYARVRNFPSALQAALFGDKVPEDVYTNLIKEVRANLDALHEYYELRRSILGLDKLELWDTRVPLVDTIKIDIPYTEAVEIVISALQVLGPEYCNTLQTGLEGRWVDRYENKGKRSGAFSAGSYHGDPYILMNYKSDVIREVFTLAHEAGHSMHSWYSVRNNPFPHYNYTIFEAEVASTFNEQLLFHHLFEIADSREMKTYLLNKRIDDVLATLFRQTMFAEFELRAHQIYEAGEGLTVDKLRGEYRSLLEAYFGPGVAIHEFADMEGLRIPHFYSAFYVYKYATGISAAIALSRNVLAGDTGERDRYFAFLKSGGSAYPLESLARAGVDMSRPEPIRAAIDLFRSDLAELKSLLV